MLLPFPFVASLIHFGSASFQFTRLHSLCIPQGEGGGQRVFLGNLKLFGKGQGELTKIFDRGGEGGGANFFSTYEKRKHYFVDFF